MAYPDTWVEKLGNGIERHHDHGHVYITRNGVDVEPCRNCEELTDEDELNDDDICPECVAEMEEEEEEE